MNCSPRFLISLCRKFSDELLYSRGFEAFQKLSALIAGFEKCHGRSFIHGGRGKSEITNKITNSEWVKFNKVVPIIYNVLNKTIIIVAGYTKRYSSILITRANFVFNFKLLFQLLD